MPMITWMADHSLYFLLGIGTIFTFIWLLTFKKRMKMHWYTQLVFSVIHTAYGVMSVMVFAIAEAGFDMKAAGNMSLFGGVFLMPLLYFIFAKIAHKKVSDVFDICTICMVFTLMCARINCLIAGCCLGNVIPGTSVHWPTREAEIVFYIILLFILGRKVKQGNTNGMIYPIYMISYGIFRFLTEGFRYTDSTSMIHFGHVWALISLLLGYCIYAELKKKGRRGKR